MGLSDLEPCQPFMSKTKHNLMIEGSNGYNGCYDV